MNKQLQEAMSEVIEELTSMSREEFLKEFENSEGDIADILLELGTIPILYKLENLVDVDETGEPTDNPITIKLESVGQIKSFIEAGIAGRESADELMKMFGKK